MDIHACLRCGGTQLDMQTISDGLVVGSEGRFVCRRCNWLGTPAIFANEQHYRAFLRGLKEATEDIHLVEA
jgi:hypothetical protein